MQPTGNGEVAGLAFVSGEARVLVVVVVALVIGVRRRLLFSRQARVLVGRLSAPSWPPSCRSLTEVVALYVDRAGDLGESRSLERQLMAGVLDDAVDDQHGSVA